MTKTKSTTKPQSKNKTPPTPKRIVMVTGNKGGTGKSVVARILLDIYRQRDINCIPYECDPSNPQLWRHYNRDNQPVKTLKLNQRGGADALQDDLLSLSPQISLVDLPAGAAEYFENLANDIYLFENAKQLGYRITMISVLGRVKDSVVQLKRLLEFCSNQVDYTVIRNLYWGASDKFSRYNNSKARQTALELGAIELNLPELFDDIFDLIDNNDLSFSEALEHPQLTLSNRSRLFGWMNAVKSEFSANGKQFGLDE